MVYVDFIEGVSAPFQFQAVLDGVQYNINVTWNIFGLRYYVNVYTIQGELILSKPAAGSPYGYDINLLDNRFASTLVFRSASNQFEISDKAIIYPDFGARPSAMLDSNSGVFILNQSKLS
jgi:hypothetical protein